MASSFGVVNRRFPRPLRPCVGRLPSFALHAFQSLWPMRRGTGTTPASMASSNMPSKPTTHLTLNGSSGKRFPSAPPARAPSTPADAPESTPGAPVSNGTPPTRVPWPGCCALLGLAVQVRLGRSAPSAANEAVRAAPPSEVLIGRSTPSAASEAARAASSPELPAPPTSV
jgi:hypothetical protein